MTIWGFVRLAVVAAVIILSAMNASWVAPQPPGVLRLIATQTEDEGGCASMAGAQKAFVAGADYLVIAQQSAPRCLKIDQARVQMPKRKFIGTDAKTYTATQPESWVWDAASARTCYDDYFKTGWLGMVPETCRGKTMLIPLDGQLKVWGWPKRFLARMNATNVRVVLSGPARADGGVGGLEDIGQLPEVPRDFTGYLLVDDIKHIGPAIRRF